MSVSEIDLRIVKLAALGVTVIRFAFYEEEDTVSVTYQGRVDRLVAAGVATAEMLAPGKKGVPKLDADGDRYHVKRNYNGGPIEVKFWKPVERALRLPAYGIEGMLERFKRGAAESP